MKKKLQTPVHRRDLLRTMITGAAAIAATQTVAVEAGGVEPRNSSDKRKARYQANSVEVQEFYRVNRYPAR
jgi:hypothetical protein